MENADRPGLAEVASTALGLWLIRTVYITPATDPAPLTGPLSDDPGRLRAHLLDHLIPSVIHARPPTRDPAEHFRPRHAWDPDQTRHYLAYLARRLTAHDTRDLAWWHLANLTFTPAQQRRITRLFGLVFGLAFGLAAGIAAGLAFGLTAGIAAGFAVEQWFNGTPGYADLRLRGRTKRLIKHLAAELAFGIAFGIAVGIAFGIAVGLIRWAEQPATTTTATTPQSTWNADRTLTLLRTTTFGLAAGIAGGLAVGVVVGVAAGVVLGNHHAWLAGGITVRRLARAGHVPRRLMAFLDDAHRLGLLRTVGPVYQFRHADLHDHLAALHFETDEPGRGR
ncbi:hypothetical protein AB0C10_04980 [Microbispora amethystogenes]|uniref:hypothetical protein n=1 Tax=Microbispora amethystogenes TaxID=1427754 RepID=UPI0033E8089A